VQKASQLVRQAAQILANEPQHTGAQVRTRYLAFVKQMQKQHTDLGLFGEIITHFCQITHNAGPWPLSMLRRRRLALYQQ
jgi:hypothetical protein